MAFETPYLPEYLSTQGLYIVSTDDGWPTKVGITDNLPERLKGMQTGNWHTLVAHKFWLAFTNLKAGA